MGLRFSKDAGKAPNACLEKFLREVLGVPDCSLNVLEFKELQDLIDRCKDIIRSTSKTAPWSMNVVSREGLQQLTVSVATVVQCDSESIELKTLQAFNNWVSENCSEKSMIMKRREYLAQLFGMELKDVTVESTVYQLWEGGKPPERCDIDKFADKLDSPESLVTSDFFGLPGELLKSAFERQLIPAHHGKIRALSGPTWSHSVYYFIVTYLTRLVMLDRIAYLERFDADEPECSGRMALLPANAENIGADRIIRSFVFDSDHERFILNPVLGKIPTNVRCLEIVAGKETKRTDIEEFFGKQQCKVIAKSQCYPSAKSIWLYIVRVPLEFERFPDRDEKVGDLFELHTSPVALELHTCPEAMNLTAVMTPLYVRSLIPIMKKKDWESSEQLESIRRGCVWMNASFRELLELDRPSIHGIVKLHTGACVARKRVFNEVGHTLRLSQPKKLPLEIKKRKFPDFTGLKETVVSVCEELSIEAKTAIIHTPSHQEVVLFLETTSTYQSAVDTYHQGVQFFRKVDDEGNDIYSVMNKNQFRTLDVVSTNPIQFKSSMFEKKLKTHPNSSHFCDGLVTGDAKVGCRLKEVEVPRLVLRLWNVFAEAAQRGIEYLQIHDPCEGDGITDVARAFRALIYIYCGYFKGVTIIPHESHRNELRQVLTAGEVMRKYCVSEECYVPPSSFPKLEGDDKGAIPRCPWSKDGKCPHGEDLVHQWLYSHSCSDGTFCQNFNRSHREELWHPDGKREPVFKVVDKEGEVADKTSAICPWGEQCKYISKSDHIERFRHIRKPPCPIEVKGECNFSGSNPEMHHHVYSHSNCKDFPVFCTGKNCRNADHFAKFRHMFTGEKGRYVDEGKGPWLKAKNELIADVRKNRISLLESLKRYVGLKKGDPLVERVITHVKGFRVVHRCKPEILDSMLQMGCLCSRRVLETDEAKLIEIMSRFILSGSDGKPSKELIKHLAELITKRLKSMRPDGSPSSVPLSIVDLKKETDIECSSLMKHNGGDKAAAEKVQDKIGQCIRALHRLKDTTPGVKHDKDKTFGTDKTVFGIYGPHTGSYYGDCQIVFKDVVLRYIDTYILPTAATCYIQSTCLNKVKMTMEYYRPWMAPKYSGDGSAQECCRSERLQPDSDEFFECLAYELLARHKRSHNIYDKDTLAAIKNDWKACDSHGVFEAHLPPIVSLDDVEIIYLPMGEIPSETLLKPFPFKRVPNHEAMQYSHHETPHPGRPLCGYFFRSHSIRILPTLFGFKKHNKADLYFQVTGKSPSFTVSILTKGGDKPHCVEVDEKGKIKVNNITNDHWRFFANTFEILGYTHFRLRIRKDSVELAHACASALISPDHFKFEKMRVENHFLIGFHSQKKYNIFQNVEFATPDLKKLDPVRKNPKLVTSTVLGKDAVPSVSLSTSAVSPTSSVSLSKETRKLVCPFGTKCEKLSEVDHMSKLIHVIEDLQADEKKYPGYITLKLEMCAHPEKCRELHDVDHRLSKSHSSTAERPCFLYKIRCPAKKSECPLQIKKDRSHNLNYHHGEHTYEYDNTEHRLYTKT